MHIAGPVNTKDEANALEQAAFLTDLRIRLASRRPATRGAVPLLHRDL